MTDTMLAAVYHGPNDLRVEMHPLPEISPSEVLIKVVSTGICGTDIRILHGAHRKYPPGTIRIPGHEVVGDIVEIGSQVTGLETGQRVLIAPNMGCGHCRQCVSGNNNLCANYDAIGITLDGSFAEYMRVPESAVLQGNLIPISKDVDPAVAALIEPFACVLRGQNALSIKPGETVLVIGAGPIGSMHMLLARLRGAAVVIVSELIPERVVQAKEMGADRVVNPSEEDLLAVVGEATDGQGVDAVIVAAPSHKAQEIAIEATAISGRINLFGGLPKDRTVIKLNSNLVHYKELVITGTTACSTDDNWGAAAIVSSGRIDLSRLIGARFPLTRANDAFAAAEEGQSLKVIIEP
jgi:L-iditol 2-dehydrogenase